LNSSKNVMQNDMNTNASKSQSWRKWFFFRRLQSLAVLYMSLPVSTRWERARIKRRPQRTAILVFSVGCTTESHHCWSCTEMLNATESFASRVGCRLCVRVGRVVAVIGAECDAGRFRLPEQPVRARCVRWPAKQASIMLKKKTKWYYIISIVNL